MKKSINFINGTTAIRELRVLMKKRKRLLKKYDNAKGYIESSEIAGKLNDKDEEIFFILDRINPEE